MSSKRDASVEEQRDRLLVGRVEHRRRRASGPSRLRCRAAAPETARAEPARTSAASTHRVERLVRRRPATRSGCVSAYSTGSSIVGAPICASTLPSTNSTNECTMLCGCTTTSIAIVRQAEEEVRLDHLERLVRERRAVDGDLAAHAPGRVLQRVGDVACSNRSADQSRKGPPDAVRMSRRTSAGRRPARHCRIAECSLSTGTISPPPRRAAVGREIAGHDQRLLVRERHALSRRERGERGIEAGGADDRVEHDVHVVAGRGLDEAFRAACASRRRRCRFVASPGRRTPAHSARPARRSSAAFAYAVSAATRNRSRCRSSTRSAVVPIEPVEPRMATPRRVVMRPAPPSVRQQPAEQERTRRAARRADVERSSTPAVAGNESRAVLHARLALEQRLHEVADLRGDADGDAEHERGRPAGQSRAARTGEARAHVDPRRRRRWSGRRRPRPDTVLPGLTAGMSFGRRQCRPRSTRRCRCPREDQREHDERGTRVDRRPRTDTRAAHRRSSGGRRCTARRARSRRRRRAAGLACRGPRSRRRGSRAARARRCRAWGDRDRSPRSDTPSGMSAASGMPSGSSGSSRRRARSGRTPRRTPRPRPPEMSRAASPPRADHASASGAATSAARMRFASSLTRRLTR